jgi:hypothetical protein
MDEHEIINGLFRYPKDKKAKGNISPYYNRLKITHEPVIMVTGTRKSLEKFKTTVETNDGTFYLGKVVKIEKTGKTFLVFDITDKVKKNGKI